MSKVELFIDGKLEFTKEVGGTTPIVVVPPPPPPPKPTPGFTVLPATPIYWGRGNNADTVNPKCPLQNQVAGTIQPYAIPYSTFMTGIASGLQMYGNTRNCKVNVSATPGDMGDPTGVHPYLNCLDGNDGMKFVAFSNPNSDSALANAGYKRLPPPSATFYVNVQADGPNPSIYNLLTFNVS